MIYKNIINIIKVIILKGNNMKIRAFFSALVLTMTAAYAASGGSGVKIQASDARPATDPRLLQLIEAIIPGDVNKVSEQAKAARSIVDLYNGSYTPLGLAEVRLQEELRKGNKKQADNFKRIIAILKNNGANLSLYKKPHMHNYNMWDLYYGSDDSDY
jgi:hypothetical protein